MRASAKFPARQSGVGLIEPLVTMIVLLIGLLGLVGLVLATQRAEAESYQRAQALILVQDMVNRINTNRAVAPCYALTLDAANGLPYVGTGTAVVPNCGLGTVEAHTLANNDLLAWSNLLVGAAETSGANNVGAMIGARGCISVDPVTNTYLITVAWQGRGPTVTPPASLACGKGMYGADTNRRAIGRVVQIAKLD